MEQLLRVQQLCDDGTALLSGASANLCIGGCRKCAGCGAGKGNVLLRAVNAIDARPGELVIVSSGGGTFLTVKAAVWLMPIGVFFAGYFAGTWLWRQGSITGCAAFAIGVAGSVLCDRLVGAKKKTVYTITGYPSQSMLESQIKGDNDLD